MMGRGLKVKWSSQGRYKVTFVSGCGEEGNNGKERRGEQ